MLFQDCFALNEALLQIGNNKFNEPKGISYCQSNTYIYFCQVECFYYHTMQLFPHCIPSVILQWAENCVDDSTCSH